MPKKTFTEHEILQLMQNPYTDHIKDDRIYYTEQFEHDFWAALIPGKSPRMVFQELGYDPALLGKKRIERYAYRVRRKHGVTMNPDYPSSVYSDKGKISSEKELEALQNEVKYLRQELDFLKKLTALQNGPLEKV